MVNYKEYINSEEWKNIKVELILSRGQKCERCNRKYQLRFLHVHHLTYDRLGNEEPGDLEILCAGCHASEHGIRTKYKPINKKSGQKKKKPKKVKLTKKQRELLNWKLGLRKKYNNKRKNLPDPIKAVKGYQGEREWYNL